ncbi:MAG TPA: porin [Polyangiaceae bacterium]
MLRSLVISSATFVALLSVAGTAHAEKVLLKEKDWEVFTDGRAAAFASYVLGDGAPVAEKMITLPDGSVVPEVINGGQWTVPTKNDGPTGQGTVSMTRIRSGFIGNTLGLGVRNQILPNLKASAYVQLWAYVESDGRAKGNPNPADVRQGYAKIEGTWGSFIAGRTRTLFSRGATDINVMYAHRFGVGFPNDIDDKGPTQGMVGFGVLGSGFGAGLIYGSPVLAGFQLNVGVFDPANLSAGGWSRTHLARLEGELTFEYALGTLGKVVAFGNGAHQKIYKNGYCVATPETGPCDETVAGFGYGGRLELGPVRLGVAGHYGKGLGMSFAFEQSYAVLDPANNLRASDGYYVQSQVVLDKVDLLKFDLFAGWGITRVFLTDLDKTLIQYSNIKHQMGINGGVVYHLSPSLHFDLEYFRAEAKWWLGEQQVLHCFSSGMTVNW